MNDELIKKIDSIKSKNILVIGDIILDEYLNCLVERISQEAPVPIALAREKKYILGGAANVANNLADLGMNVELIGQIGTDIPGDNITKLMLAKGIKYGNLIITEGFNTITKTRIVSAGHQMIRIDQEDYRPLSSESENLISKHIENNLNKYDLIIISDYAKGFINKDLAQKIIIKSRELSKIVIGDPKPIHKDFYKNINLITPNTIEAEAMTGIKSTDDQVIDKIGKTLQQQLNCDVVLTRGEKGMAVFEKDKKFMVLPKIKKQVYDVTGAGDTVISVIAACLANDINLSLACEIASVAAGIVVGKAGTATTNLREIKKDLN